jgi:hypothetical protein
MQISKDQAAFITVSVLAAATAGTVFAAVATASKVAAIAYRVLAITGAGASIASVTAWMDTNSKTAGEYLSVFKEHASKTILGAYQFTSQTLVAALVQGVADGVRTAIRRAISGPDVTVRQN